MSDNNNAWVVQAPKEKFEPLPVGAYFGKYLGVETIKVAPNQFSKPDDSGERWSFRWEVQSQEHNGKIANALTNKTIDPKSPAGVIIKGLLGRDLIQGEDVKAAIDDCKGKLYLLTVAAGPKGGKPCVRTVNQPPQM